MTANPLDRLFGGSAKLDAALIEWTPTDTPGFYLKMLFHDAATGEETFLMKMDAGAFAPRHAHNLFEEIFVLEGDFFDAVHSYSAGQYCARAIGAEHEAGSRNGGIVLITYRS